MSRAVPFRRLGRLALLLGIAGALALAFWGGGGSPRFQAVRQAAVLPPVSPELTRGSVLRRRLAAGASHTYRIRLQAGSSLRLIVTQLGIDVCVDLWSPAGERLLEVDSPNGTEGPEELAAVVAEAGEHRIAVRGAAASPGGTYELRVEEVRPATGEDRRRAIAVQAFAQAEQLRALGRAEPLRAAIGHYEEALRLWPHSEVTPWKALVLRRLGQTWFTLGEVRRAHRPLQQALSFYEERGDRTEEARLLNEIGPTWRLLGEPDRAAACYQRVLRLARETGDRAAEITALNNLGVVYHTAGETQKSLTFLEGALAGWRELADPAREADTLHNLGENYTLLGRFEEGIALLNQALALKRQADDRRGQALILTALGWAHDREEDLAAALRAYDRALVLRRETGDQRGEAATLDRRATVLSKLGRKSEALAAYRTALAILRRVGDRTGEAQVLASLGWLDESADRPAPALRHFEQALRLFQQLGDQHGEAYIRWGSARAARRLGRLPLAQAQIEEALRIVESIHREVQSRPFRTSYLAARQEYYGLYVQILMERHAREPGRGWEAKALEASNRARARSLLESLAEAQADHLAATEPELLAAVQALATRIRARELRRLDLLQQPSAGREIAALERELSALLLESGTLQGKMRGTNPRVAALRQAPPLTVREIQRLLDPETLLLWYALGAERSFLWIVGPDSIATCPLAGRAEIEAAARQVHGLLTNSHKKGLREQARLAAAVLSDLVLGPAAGRLGGKRLLIASDGALQYIPFAALPVGPRRVPLLAGHEIVHIPSAAVLALVRRGLAGRRPAPRTLAMVADPVFRRDDPRVLRRPGAAVPARLARPAAEAERAARERAAREAGLDSFDRLVYSAAEAQAILALVPEAERLQALGFRASRATVLGGELRRYRILHFATHGLLNARHPELSGVVLSLVDEAGRPQDGFLRVHDLVHLSFPADLVVLSACRTALGKEIPGEGLVGLTHGFLVAGAGRVLVSLWNVNDLATAELMERFYRHHLRDGMRAAEALRAAQLSMLREERWSAPYYWAGFTLQGEWR